MEEGPESEPTSNIRFISDYDVVLSPEEVTLPDDQCSLVATAAKYGLIFVGCVTVFKVFESRTVVKDGKKNPLASINTGATITHITCSCDGLTLLVVILHNNVPHVLFYEIRNFVPGCENQVPFVSTLLSTVSGARVQGLAWNPLDPCSVAIATSPGTLSIISLKENEVDVKSKEIQARAVGWSPKGKQLTVGLADGTLELFKPDLTPVRTVSKPPMDGIGSVLSITWFTNTEFFIGYKIDSEEGGHVMMYVSAPKAKESRFVTYDYLCNYNQGPRPAMFYPTFFAEWNLLCLLSSRANQLGVLGQSESGSNMWCEYEMEEGAAAVVQNISVTEETFPLGMSVDFTSERTFTAKDESTFGPCPVIFTLSTGGGLNMFHVVNRKPGAEALNCVMKNLPNSGHRTPQQYSGAASYIAPADGAFINIPKFAISTPSGIQGLPVSTPATTTEFVTPTRSTFPVTSSASSLFNSSVPEPLSGTGQRPKLAPFSQQMSDNAKPNFSFTKTSPGLSAPGASASTSSFFGTAKPPSPSVFNASGVPTFSPFSSASNMPISTTEDTKESHAGNGAQQTPNTTGQGLKFTFQLPQASSVAGSISQGKPALNTINVTPLKAKSPTRTDIPKQNDAQISSRSPGPAAVLPSLIAGKEVDSNLISTIAAATAQFEEELHNHVNVNESINEIGEKQEMGTIRRCIIEESEWINQMSCTTVELKSEISQLHSEVLEGYTLLEEAEAQLNKSKNPRYFLSLQSRPLDPRSRKKLEEIRSLYQYLQSQMVEINTRLHLDWAAFTNNMNNKKKHELPASETLYQALRKCNSLRRMCERQVDTLCDRLKALQISFLTFGLSSHRQYEDDDCLDNLERTLKETTLSPSPRLTPLKMLPPQKQTKLQKVLSQRNIIPLRKCSNIPKMDLTSLETLSLSYGQNGLPDRSTSQQVQQSFPSNLDSSMSTSFGPQTFSTPNRISKLSSVKDGVETPKKTVIVRGIPGNVKASSVGQTSSQFVPLPQVGSDMSSTSNAGSKSNKFSALCVPTANKTSGFTFSSVSGGNSRVSGNESVGIAKPQYEDVTPPQTPDNQQVTGMKAASPLLALSSLVSKVPTTTAVDATPPSSASHSEAKSIFGDTFSINLTSDVPKSLTTDAAAISLKDFSPKSLSSLKTTLPSSVPFSFTPFSPPTTVFSAAPAGNSSVKAQDVPSGSFLFKLPSTAVESTSTATASQFTEASQANVTSSSLFSFKSTTLSTTNSDTPFTFKSSTPASGQLTSVSSTNSEGSLSGPGSSSISSSLSKPSNLFSGMIPGTVDIGSNSSLTITAIPFTSPDLAGASISSLPSTSSETTPTAESDSASSASTDSDTVSNANIGSDNVHFSSGSISFRLETSAADELEIQAAPASTLTPVSLLSSSSSTFNKHASSVTGSGLTKAPSDDAPETSQETESSGLFGNNRSPTPLKPFSLPTSSTSIFGGSSGMTGGLFGSASGASGSIAASNTTATVTTITTTAAATKSSSIFGGMTSSISIFGNELGSSNGNILGGIPSSTDSSVNSISSTSSSTTSAGIFSPTPGRGLFASSATSSGGLFSSPATTSSGGIFAITSTTSSGGLFASTATTSSGGLFASTATTSSGGLFASTATTSSGGLFSSTVTTSSGGLFVNTATTSSGGLFSSTATTTSGGLFSSTATTSSGSLFGTTLSLGSGQGTGSIPTTSSIFGSSLSSASSTGSLFGASASAVSSPTVGQTSVFGTTTTSSGSAFSSPSTAASGFSVNTTTSTTGGSAFGQTATQSSSGFGQNSQSSGSLFGTPTTTGSVFGNSGQSGSLFGSATSQGTGIFGGTPTQSSGSSVFGQPTISSGFNSGSDGSVFGQSSTAASSSPFSTTSTTKPETSLFGSSAGFGAESGGGFFSGLGSKPSEESASKNVFGSTAFSTIKPQSSLFGGSSTNSSVFGSSVFGNTASSASNSNNTSATGQVAQSGFGVTSPQSPAGFGSGTAFGSPPSFGGAPSFTSPKFGSPPTFGGTATFGSPLSGATGGGFSSFASTGASTFGSVANSSPATSPGFGSFSGQNSAASFGGLAQSANQQQGSAFGSGANVFGRYRDVKQYE